MTQTYGEKRVERLLKSLPSNRYFFVAEPEIVGSKTTRSRPDFVVVSAERGVIVLEVKDWKNIVSITQKKVTIIRDGMDGVEEEEDNPVEIAHDYALNLADAFEARAELRKKYRGREVLRFPWMYAAIIVHLDNDTKRKAEGLIWEKGRVLNSEDLQPDRFEKALQSIPAKWRLEKPLNKDILNIIRGVLDPELIVHDAKGEDVGTITVEQERIIKQPIKIKPAASPMDDFLTDEAIAVSQNTSVRLVRGVAGSGKSLVLAKRAQFLAANYPDANILVLAFNKDLVKDLEKRIGNIPSIEVVNFHKLCSNILGSKWRPPQKIEEWLSNWFADLMEQSNLTPEFVASEIEWRKELELYDNAEYLNVERKGRGRSLNKNKREVINTIMDQYIDYHHNESIRDWSDVPFVTLAELQTGHPLRHTYDFILIDEAQDFAPSWIKVILKLIKSNGDLFICDDPSQSLFRAFSWKQKGIEVRGRTRVLRVPFRCTREITLAAHSLINIDNTGDESEEIVKPDLQSYELASGDKPKVILVNRVEQEIKRVEDEVNILIHNGIMPSSIAILCHTKRIIKHWAHLRNQACYVGTFNQMKGLEFHAVLIPHLHTYFQVLGQEVDSEYIDSQRKKLFTAMTRAREMLILSATGNLPTELTSLQPYVELLYR
ncbi:MAG: hypothetical protein D6737_05225 [Chloroflexi bacterium]|nr:MAG: hypothetical protein D6737_05225 [Chloroflexota bacterium]